MSEVRQPPPMVSVMYGIGVQALMSCRNRALLEYARKPSWLAKRIGIRATLGTAMLKDTDQHCHLIVEDH